MTPRSEYEVYQFCSVQRQLSARTLLVHVLVIATSVACFLNVQCESKKIPPPPKDMWQFFQNGCEFFNQILHAYYVFLSTLDYEFLFNYLQL